MQKSKQFLSLFLSVMVFCLLLWIPAVAQNDRLGDIDGDGFITPGDALIVLKASVGLMALDETQTAQADVDANGRVDAADSLWILKYSIHLINQFPAHSDSSLPDESMPDPSSDQSDVSSKEEMDPNMQTPALIDTIYPTHDLVVADLIATSDEYGADPTGQEDSTKAIQNALKDCSDLGGGTVFLPVGSYRVTGNIWIPPFVTLRGDWADPDVYGGGEYGTVILADLESANVDQPSLFLLGGSSGVMGLTVYYPNQTLDNVKPYPYTFYVRGSGTGYMLQSIVNCTVLNGYKGIGACVNESNAHEMMTIENVKGTFLKYGAVAYNQADVGTWKNVTISGKYWSEASEAYGAPDREALDEYTRENTVGLMLGDLEWTQFSNLSISDCKVGIQIVNGKRIQFAGSFVDATVTGCVRAMDINNMDSRWGTVMARCTLQGSEYSVRNGSSGVVKMTDVTLDGPLNKGVFIEDTSSLENERPDYTRSYVKPAARLYVLDVDKTGKTDISEALQAMLDEAETTGGAVYLPAGFYKLEHPVMVPAGVELKGSTPVARRGQVNLSGGTNLWVYCGADQQHPDTAQAAITLMGKNAGVNGIGFIYPGNNPLNGAQRYTYTIRGMASGVYAVNLSLSAAWNGIDFSGCDNSFIKKVVSLCYKNAIAMGGNGGMIEGCLQNGTTASRNGYHDEEQFPEFAGWLKEGDLFTRLFNPITRITTEYIKLKSGENITVMSCFAYGVKTLIVCDGTNNALVSGVGADNLGEDFPLLRMTSGSLTAINVMRYNGVSYQRKGGSLTIYNRLTINNKTESTLRERDEDTTSSQNITSSENG